MFVIFYAFGALCLGLAGYLGQHAWYMDIAVTFNDRSVANASLMNAQLIEFMLAMGFLITAAILIGFGAVLENRKT
ncbi:MAG: hypothetical protein V4461_11035 [Pseudomonadota bacterium]